MSSKERRAPDGIRISEIRSRTGIRYEDIISTLEYMQEQCMSYDSTEKVISASTAADKISTQILTKLRLKKNIVDVFLGELDRKPFIDVSCLRWKPVPSKHHSTYGGEEEY